MDGHALGFDDNGFVMAGSQFRIMLFPDMPKGISEMARVVKPSGRLLLHAYGDPHAIEFLGFLISAVQSVRPDFDDPRSPQFTTSSFTTTLLWTSGLCGGPPQ